MKIQCTNCGNTEETNKDFFVKLIGGAMPVGGYSAWVTYLFAGTGFAMAIVVAIIGGGVAMLIYKDEIVEWIINNDYKCPKCGQLKWKADDESENDLVAIAEIDRVINESTACRSTTVEESQAVQAKPTTFSKELFKGIRLLSSAVTATPEVVRELVKLPLTATAAFNSETNGTSYELEEAKLLAKLPSSAKDGVKQAVIGSSNLVAKLLNEKKEPVEEKLSAKHSFNTTGLVESDLLCVNEFVPIKPTNHSVSESEIYSEEEAKLYAELPKDLPEAVKQAYIATARLSQQMMKEDS